MKDKFLSTIFLFSIFFILVFYNISLLEANPHTGTYCAKIEDANGNGYIYQTIRVSSNTSYDFSAWVYDASTTDSIVLKIYWYSTTDGSGRNIGSKTSTASIDTNEWQHLFLRATSPASAQSAKVSISFNSGENSVGFVDDVIFVQTNSTTTLLENNDFETGQTTPWFRYGIDKFTVVTSTSDSGGSVGGINISALITEVAPSETNDWIEIFITDDCDIGGVQLYEQNKLITTFPNISAKKNDFIVVWCNSSQPSEDNSTGKGSNNYWDVYTTYSGITATDSVLSLRKRDGSYVDAVIYSNRDGTTFSPKTDYDNLVENNQWLPPSAPTWSSADYENNSVNWKGGGKGKSIARKKGTDSLPVDTNSMSDWELKTLPTPGYGYKEITETTQKYLEVDKNTNPFCPEDSQNSFVAILFNIPDVSAKKTITIFDIKGKEIIKLLDNDIPQNQTSTTYTGITSGSVVWDGMDKYGNRVPTGVYIVYLDAYNSSTGQRYLSKDVVVVGRKF